MFLAAQFAQHARARHAVVHEARGQRLPGFPVVDNVFAKDLSDALHHATVQLAFDDRMVDDRAAVVDRTVAHDFRGARFLVHFDFRDMAAVGKSRAELAFGDDFDRLCFRQVGQRNDAL